MVEAPMVLQSQLEGKIPADHLAACKALDIPTAGNAAGNTVNLLDLSGENKPPGRIPNGFTPRGIVALAFSVVSAVLGLIVIGWYGAAEIPGAKGLSGGTMRRVG
jgi:iron transport multicopper oxidase